jgi:hypothetical protein
MLTWGTISEYLERSFLEIGEDPVAWAAQGIAVLDRPYLRLVTMRRADPWSNWVDRAVLAPEQVPGAIQEARAFIAGEDVPYAWCCLL